MRPVSATRLQPDRRAHGVQAYHTTSLWAAILYIMRWVRRKNVGFSFAPHTVVVVSAYNKYACVVSTILSYNSSGYVRTSLTKPTYS